MSNMENLTSAIEALKAIDPTSLLGLNLETERFGLNEGVGLPKISGLKKILKYCGEFRDPYCFYAYFLTIAWFANEGLAPPNVGDNNWPNFIMKIKAKLITLLPENGDDPWKDEAFRNEQFLKLSKLTLIKKEDLSSTDKKAKIVQKSSETKILSSNSNLEQDGLPNEIIPSSNSTNSKLGGLLELSDSEEEPEEKQHIDLQMEGLDLKPISTTFLKKTKKGKTISQQNVIMSTGDDVVEELDALATDFFRIPETENNGTGQEINARLMTEDEIVTNLKSNYVKYKNSKGDNLANDFISNDKFLETMTQLHVTDNFRYFCKFKTFFNYLFWILFPFTYLNRLVTITQGAFYEEEVAEKENKNYNLFTFFNDSIVKLSSSLDPIQELNEDNVEEDLESSDDDDAPFISSEDDSMRSLTNFFMLKQFLDYLHSLHFQKNYMSVQNLNSMIRAALTALYTHVKDEAMGPLLKTFWTEINAHNNETMTKYYKCLKISTKNLYNRFVMSEIDQLIRFRYLQATIITVNKKGQTFLLRLYASEKVSNELQLTRQQLFSQRILQSCYNLNTESILDSDIVQKLVNGQAKLEKYVAKNEKTNLSILSALQANKNFGMKKPTQNKEPDYKNLTRNQLIQLVRRQTKSKNNQSANNSKLKLADFTSNYSSGTIILPETEKDLTRKLGTLSQNLPGNRNYVTVNNVVYYNIPKGYRKQTDPQYTACCDNLKVPNKALIAAVSKIRKKTGL